MKKFFFSMSFMLVVMFGLQAQVHHVHFRGQVTDSNNIAVHNQAVTIQADSGGANGYVYFQVTHTNYNGYYGKVVHVPAGVINFTVSTVDCNGIVHSGTGLSTADSVIINFVICPVGITPPPPPPCHSNFTFHAEFSNPQEIEFHNISTGFPATYFWNFGDGDFSTQIDPHHVYAQAGTYNVCLTMVNTTGCTDTLCKEVVVFGPPPPPPCHAKFTSHALNSNPLEIAFHNISTGFPATYSWTFGDGDTSSQIDPHHVYAQAATYTVCLVMLSSTGCTDTLCKEILVNSPPPPPPCFNKFCPHVHNLEVVFYGHAFGGVAPYTYLWDFGDGDTSSAQTPVHTYAFPGSYTVTFTTTDAAGCIYITTHTVTVLLPDPGPFDVSGTVFAGVQVVNSGWVILYQPDSSTNLVQLDSVSLDSTGSYSFLQVPAGAYFIKAFPDTSSVFADLFIPTYYPHHTFPGFQSLIHLGPLHNPYNIFLRHHHHPFFGIAYNSDIPGAEGFKSVTNPVAVQQLTLNNVYPNPSTTSIAVDLSVNLGGNYEIAVFNLTGQKLLSQNMLLNSGNSNIVLGTGDLSSGIYTLRIVAPDGNQVSSKICVNR